MSLEHVAASLFQPANSLLSSPKETLPRTILGSRPGSDRHFGGLAIRLGRNWRNHLATHDLSGRDAENTASKQLEEGPYASQGDHRGQRHGQDSQIDVETRRDAGVLSGLDSEFGDGSLYVQMLTLTCLYDRSSD